MSRKRLLTEQDLAGLAKDFRQRAGKTKAQASVELGVNSSTMHLSEEAPEQSLTKLRCRIIEKYSSYRVVGPVYLLQRK